MFEDLIEEKPEFIAKTGCPHCESMFVFRYQITGMNGQYRQKSFCKICKKVWYIIYNSKMKQTGIRYTAEVVG